MLPSKNLPIVDWLEIKASAPAKFIISGEYSVVYEKQAIASAIDLRTTVTIKPGKDSKLRVHFKNLNSLREWPCASLTMCRLVNKFSDCLDYNESMQGKLSHLVHPRYELIRNTHPTVDNTTTTAAPSTSRDPSSKETDKKADDAAMAFLLLYIGLGDSYSSSARPPLEVEVNSDIPVGSGLGSSSAFSVALCGALMRVFRVAAEKYIISNWAFNIDRFFHGKPSGIDNNVSTHGKSILFQGGRIKANGCTHNAKIRVLLVDTNVSRSTKTLSEIVIKQLRDDPNSVNGIFNSINELTTQIWRKFNDPDFVPRQISDHIMANQNLLNNLGVGHEFLTDICLRASVANYAAKQTGAGGGGIAFILYDAREKDPNLDLIRDDFVRVGYKVHDHEINCEGLAVGITPDPDRRTQY